MMQSKVVKKKNGKTDQLIKNLQNLSKQKLEVGHFASSGLHGSSDLSYVELLQGWAAGTFQEGVRKNPMAAFQFMQLRNGGILKNPKVKAAYIKWSKNLDNKKANMVFLEEVGEALRRDYMSMFGKTGHMMPIIGSNTTPLLDTGELKSATAYKSSYDNVVKEVGI